MRLIVQARVTAEGLMMESSFEARYLASQVPSSTV
jgi:hypothetical protein